MKRIVSLSLALLLLCTLCSCQKADNQPSETYALYVDGKVVGAMETTEEIQAVLDGLMENYAAPDDTKQELSFVQEIKIVPGQYPESSLLTADQLTEKLTQTVGENKFHWVEAGETLGSIATKHNLTLTELLSLNPEIKDSTDCQIGTKLRVSVKLSFLQVCVAETVTHTETIDYETVITYRDDKPSAWSKLITKGTLGKKEVQTKNCYVDGVLVDKRVIGETVIVAPVSEVKEIGCKDTEQKDYTGIWTWPVPVCHVVSRSYGIEHLAIDISGGEEPVLDTPCLAVDGGKVVYADWQQGYGYHIKIDHGNGLVTTYSHLQSIAVKVGQQVSNGQEIGKVGNSGTYSDPHLHFEVIKNGVKANPLDYIKP